MGDPGRAESNVPGEIDAVVVGAGFAGLYRRNRYTKGGVPPRISMGVSAMSVSERERRANFEQAWGFGTKRLCLETDYCATFNFSRHTAIAEHAA